MGYIYNYIIIHLDIYKKEYCCRVLKATGLSFQAGQPWISTKYLTLRSPSLSQCHLDSYGFIALYLEKTLEVWSASVMTLILCRNACLCRHGSSNFGPYHSYADKTWLQIQWHKRRKRPKRKALYKMAFRAPPKSVLNTDLVKPASCWILRSMPMGYVSSSGSYPCRSSSKGSIHDLVGEGWWVFKTLVRLENIELERDCHLDDMAQIRHLH